MMNRIILFSFLALVILPGQALAEAPAWQVRDDESNIYFTSTENGKPVVNKVGSFNADIHFSPDALDDSHVMVTIPVSEFKRDDAEALLTMQEQNFFDAANYPDIVFTADQFKKTGETDYIAHGNLAIKDTVLPYDLPFTLEIADGTAEMTADAPVLRLPYKIGTGSWADTEFIADEVRVQIRLIADKAVE